MALIVEGWGLHDEFLDRFVKSSATVFIILCLCLLEHCESKTWLIPTLSIHPKLGQ